MRKSKRLALMVAVLLSVISLVLVSSVSTVTMAQGAPAKPVIQVKIHVVAGSNVTAANITNWLNLAGSVWGCSFNVTHVNNDATYNRTANVANVLNVWGVPQKSWGTPSVSGYDGGDEIQLPPGDGADVFIKNSTLAHEVGHLLGQDHNLTDPGNIMYPDNQGDPPKSCHRTGTNTTGEQQQGARNSTAVRAHDAISMGHGTSQWDACADVPCNSADLTFTQAWATSDEVYLTLLVTGLPFDDIPGWTSLLGFYLETDGDPATGDPQEGLDYYVGLYLMAEGGVHHEEVVFERYDQSWVSLDPTGITYEWVYATPDADLSPIITGVRFILPIDELERMAGDLLSFRATGQGCYDLIDKSPDAGLYTFSYVPEEYNLTVSSTAGGLVTAPGNGTFTYDPGTVVDLLASSDTGYLFANWSGDVDTIADVNDASTTITMNDSYSIRANFSRAGGCFIATAAYGSPMAEEIQILREFRDEYLLTNRLGQAFTDFYYKASPPIVDFINEHPSLKPIVRAGLVPAVVMSTIAVNTAPAEKVALLAFLALASVAMALLLARRRGTDPERS